MTGCRYFMNALNCYKQKIAFILLALMVLFPAVVFASGACLPVIETTVEAKIKDAFKCDPSLTGITYRLTECSKSILENVADSAFDTMLKGLSKAVFATLTMFVALTGYKMILGGVRNLKAEALTMLLKLVFVAYMALWTGTAGTSGLKMVYGIVTGMSSGMVDLVSSSIGSSGPCSTTTDAITGSAIPETNLWKRIDCTILVFIGRVGTAYESRSIDLDQNGAIEGDENNVSVLKTTTGARDLNCDGVVVGVGGANADGSVSRVDEINAPKEDFTLFEIGLSQLFTPHGIFIMALLAAASLMIFFAMYKALMVYIISFIAITFLFLVSPIFFPLFLFARTRQMFLTWVAMIIGYTLQPAMLMAFVAFLLATINVAVHGTTDASGHLISPGLKQTLESMNDKMEKNECTVKVIGWKENKMFSKLGVNIPIPDFEATMRKSGVEVNALTVPTTPVNYKDLSLFMVQLLGCIVLLYIMMGLLTNVSEFVRSLSAGSGSDLSKIGGEMKQLAGTAKDALSNVTQK